MSGIGGKTGAPGALGALDMRSREIFRSIVESYLDSGEPVGSRHLSRILPMPLSPASIRNVMQDLEELGLVYAPHTSAGRLPTETGLRFFVDSLLQVGELSPEERIRIESQVAGQPTDAGLEALLGQASSLLSGLTRGASVVVTSKDDRRLRQIEFVRLDPGRALAVLVSEDGSVENRLITIDPGTSASALIEAANYINQTLRGQTLSEAKTEMENRRAAVQAELDQLTSKLVDAGIASWASAAADRPETLIVRGQSNLLEDVKAADDLQRIRLLFDYLETQRELISLLSRAERAQGETP